jgi:hypothetical protein
MTRTAKADGARAEWPGSHHLCRGGAGEELGPARAFSGIPATVQTKLEPHDAAHGRRPYELPAREERKVGRPDERMRDACAQRVFRNVHGDGAQRPRLMPNLAGHQLRTASAKEAVPLV